VNTGALWPSLEEAGPRVLAMQTKLHQWAVSDPDRRFDDLYNLLYDPAFLVVAWDRVRSNKGARSAGIDGIVPRSIEPGGGEFLEGVREELRARRYTPTRVRERMIPKASGKLRRLGIATAADRVVQAVLKLVLEPVMDKVRTITRRRKHRTLADLLRLLNRVLRGWCNYFRHGVSAQTFHYLDHFTWWRVVGWMRKRHDGLNWGTLRRRYLPGWEIRDGQTEMFRPQQVAVDRYRYRGTQIPTPWTNDAE
jgi:retron-type reverse transcriptase